MPCVILSLNHCQSTSDSFQYCICRRSVSGECRSGQLGVQAVTWQLLVQYVCYHIHICFSSRSHPRSCQLSQAELSMNAWYAELSKSIIQPVWMCIAEVSIGISFIQCSTNRWILGSPCRGSGDREKKWEEMVPKIPFLSAEHTLSEEMILDEVRLRGSPTINFTLAL